MMQKIVCHNGKCRDVKAVRGFQRSDLVGLIEEDLFRSEAGDLDDYGEE